MKTTRFQLAYFAIGLLLFCAIITAASYTHPVWGDELSQATTPVKVWGELAFTGQSPAAVDADYTTYLPIIQKPDALQFVSAFGGRVTAVSRIGNYAYVGYGVDFAVFDMSNPAAPVQVDQLDTGIVSDIAIQENIAYLTVSGDLLTIDISNPARPVQIGYLHLHSAKQVAVQDDLAVVASTYDVYTIDISNPYNLVETAVYDDGDLYLSGVAIDGNTAYIGDHDSLLILDISNPAAPQKISEFTVDGYIHAIRAVNNLVYLIDSTWLHILDVTNPAAPQLTGNLQLFANTSNDAISNMTIDGNKAYIAVGRAGMRIVDISNPAAPTQIGSYGSEGHVDDIFIQNSIAHIADGLSGQLITVNIANVASIQPISSVGNFSAALTIDVNRNNDTLYIADGFSNIIYNDFTNPANPAKMGEYDTSSCAMDVFIKDNLAYSSGYGGFQITNISDPAHPQLVSRIQPFYGPARDIKVYGDLAYVGGNTGLHIINVSNPSNPYRVGYFSSKQVYNFAVANGYAYLSVFASIGDDPLIVVDVSNPSSPSFISSYAPANDAQLMSMEVQNNTLYAAAGTDGFIFLDVSNPANVQEIVRYSVSPFEPANSIHVKGDIIYTLQPTAGVWIADVSDIMHPYFIANYPLDGNPWSITVEDDLIHMLMNGGVTTIRYQK